MSLRAIDLEHWPRRQHFEHFISYARPFSTLCVRQDVSALRDYCRTSHSSRFGVMCHAVMWALNQVKPLRQRVIDGQPYELDQIDVSFTALAKDGENFNFCTAPFDEDRATFLEHVQQAIVTGQAQAEQGLLFTGDDHRVDLAYVTCLPWLDFSALEHAFMGDKTDFIPRIAWGKMVEQEHERVEVSVSLCAHHAFVDGLHMARFFEALTHYINQLPSQ